MKWFALVAMKRRVSSSLPMLDKWYGVTYKEDKEIVMEAFRRMKAEGRYPQKLWG